MASLWMKIFIKVAHNEYFEFPLYCKIVNFVIFLHEVCWKAVTFLVHSSMHTYLVVAQLLFPFTPQTPPSVQCLVEAPPRKGLLTTGRLKTNLTDGHKQSSEFAMATKIFCQGMKAMNQYAEGIACPIEMLILWHFGNSCSTFTVHTPWKLTGLSLS